MRPGSDSPYLDSSLDSGLNSGSDPDTGRHRLGPHVVGQRVVVRRLLRGQVGPSGGPAMTDVLGVCTTWGADSCVVESDAGPVTIALADIVSGKPVPPRPSVRHRVPPREIHLRSIAMWSDVERAELGDWVLRAGGPAEGGRIIARANSVLAMGDPGVPLDEAVTEVLAFYDRHQRPAWAQVVAGGEVDTALVERGWVPARPDEADSVVQLASVAQLMRTLSGPGDTDRGDTGPAGSGVSLDVDGPRALAELDGRSRGRAAVDGDWVGLHDLWTDPAHRRQGLMRLVLAELLDWAASVGATTAYLQVRADNPGALALYESLGFRTHHTYRYLAAPS